MSRGFKMRIDGLDNLVKDLSTMPEKVQDGVSEILNKNIVEINAEQKRRAPVDQGRLRQSIGFDISDKNNKQVFSNAKYSAYVEFGTGGVVSIPNGLEEVASQYKGRGVRKINLPARPFFFAPFLMRKDKILEDIKRFIEKI